METEAAEHDSDGMETPSTSSHADLRVKLLERSSSFTDHYDRRRDHLETTLDTLTKAAVGVRQMHQETKKLEKVRGLCGAVGGAVTGAGIGAVTGAIGGAFGAVIGAAGCKVLDDIGAVSAVGGLVGSVIGGGAGGVVAGAVGGAFFCSVEAAGGLLHSVVGHVVITVGGVVGGAVGGIFGGEVGTAGGAVGGAFGAFCGTGVAVAAVGSVVGQFNLSVKTKESNMDIKEANIKRIGEHFHETIKPLMKELKAITKISGTLHNMSPSATMQGVARQSMNALAAATILTETFADTEALKVEAAKIQQLARRCKDTAEEFEKMRAELDKLLASLR
ncbi:uncharacterized protein ACJ7VT_004464 [Polymixia lowei]